MIPELNCPECRGNRFRYPSRLESEASVICEDCGHSQGTFAELKERVAAEVLAQRSRKTSPPPRT